MDRLNIKLQPSNWKDWALIYLGFGALSLYLTEPTDVIGVLITLATIFPLLLSIVPLYFRWKRHFGGSKLIAVLTVILMLGALWLITGIVIPALEPYIGEHYA